MSDSNAGSNATSLAKTAVALATGAITPQGPPCRDSRYGHPALVAPPRPAVSLVTQSILATSAVVLIEYRSPVTTEELITRPPIGLPAG